MFHSEHTEEQWQGNYSPINQLAPDLPSTWDVLNSHSAAPAATNVRAYRW